MRTDKEPKASTEMKERFIKGTVYINEKEAESLFFAIDFIEGMSDGADEEPAKRIGGHLKHLINIFRKLKK